MERAEETRVANEKISNDLKAKYPDEASFIENIEEITSTLKEISTINVAPAPEFDALPMLSGSSGSGQFVCGVEEPAPIAGLKQVPKNCISWSKKKGYDRAMFVVTLDGNQVSLFSLLCVVKFLIKIACVFYLLETLKAKA